MQFPATALINMNLNVFICMKVSLVFVQVTSKNCERLKFLFICHLVLQYKIHYAVDS